VGADDRPVANLVIGVQAIQKASAGGHTLRFRTRSTMAVGEALIMNLPHEPLVDIVPRAIGCRTWPYAAASAGLEPWASIAGSSGRQPI
jgi:tripartite-type tricarboxylate transporter receptor subunit TctC